MLKLSEMAFVNSALAVLSNFLAYLMLNCSTSSRFCLILFTAVLSRNESSSFVTWEILSSRTRFDFLGFVMVEEPRLDDLRKLDFLEFFEQLDVFVACRFILEAERALLSLWMADARVDCRLPYGAGFYGASSSWEG